MLAANRSIPWPFGIVAGGAVAGALLGLWIGPPEGADSVWPATIFLGLGGFVIALVLVVDWLGSRPFYLQRHVPIEAQAIHDHSERWFGRAPWVLARNDPNALVYWRRTEPIAGTIFFLLLGILPGILYYFWARGTQTVALNIAPAPGGTDLRIVGHPQGSDGRNRAVDFFNSLHRLAPGSAGRRP
jgi:hypothetical protein